MEKVGAEELAVFLLQHLDCDLVERLKDQKIKGKDFLSLTQSNLKLFGFTLGDVLTISNLQQKLNSGELKYKSTVGDSISSNEDRTPVRRVSIRVSTRKSTTPASTSASTSSKKADCHNKTDSSVSPADEDNVSSIISEGDDNDSDSDSELLEWMSQEELSELSHYEKINYKNTLDNFKEMKERGLTSSLLPSGFMVFQKSRDKAGIPDTSSRKPNQKSTGGALVPPRSSARLRSTSRVQLVNPRVESSGEEEVSDKENSPKEPEHLYRPDPTGLKRTKQQLLEIKPQLGQIDVVKILKDHPKTKDKIAAWLEQGYVLASKDRKTTYRVLVRHLSFQIYKHPSEVKTEMLETLAKSFCCMYPQYQKPIDRPNSTPWSHIYSPVGNKGHFANVRKRTQTSLPQEQRDRIGKSKRRKSNKTLSVDHDVDIQALALMWPGRAEKDEIFDAMSKTYQYRENQRKKGASITEMITEFPHFHNYNGELISNEFSLMFPQAKDMCPLFMKHVPKILEKWPAVMRRSSSNDSTAQACFTLACKLPHIPRESVQSDNGDDSTGVLPVENELIVFTSAKVDLCEYAERRRLHHAGPVQPYLIGVKSDLTSEVLKFFLVLDGRPMELGKIPTIRGIDWVFKSCVVFNVFFPRSWTSFFRLLQTCYYQVFLTDEDDAPPSAIEYFKNLQGV